jgi:hypothetical protein
MWQRLEGAVCRVEFKIMQHYYAKEKVDNFYADVSKITLHIGAAEGSTNGCNIRRQASSQGGSPPKKAKTRSNA